VKVYWHRHQQLKGDWLAKSGPKNPEVGDESELQSNSLSHETEYKSIFMQRKGAA
jgi:hypothetical protein